MSERVDSALPEVPEPYTFFDHDKGMVNASGLLTWGWVQMNGRDGLLQTAYPVAQAVPQKYAQARPVYQQQMYQQQIQQMPQQPPVVMGQIMPSLQEAPPLAAPVPEAGALPVAVPQIGAQMGTARMQPPMGLPMGAAPMQQPTGGGPPRLCGAAQECMVSGA